MPDSSENVSPRPRTASGRGRELSSGPNPMKTLRFGLLAALPLLAFGCTQQFEQDERGPTAHVDQERTGDAIPARSSAASAGIVATENDASLASPAPSEGRYCENRFYRAHDKFLATDSPPVVTADEATFLSVDDEVFGLVVSGQARAYPVRPLCYHHAVNDTIKDTTIVVTYCVICSSGIAFDPIVNGRQLTFGFHGIWQGAAVLYDRQTQSKWLHLTGECIEGPLKGTTLKAVPGRHVLWSEWKRDHPDTEVMGEEQRFVSRYTPSEWARRGLDYFPKGFLPTIETTSDVLSASALCYGIKTSAAAKAYPFETLMHVEDGVLNDQVGNVPVVVVVDKATGSAAGHGRTLDGEVLEFERTADGLLRDRKTRSIFNRDGFGVSGMHQGRRLPTVVGLQAEWYGWFAAYPATSVYGVEAD